MDATLWLTLTTIFDSLWKNTPKTTNGDIQIYVNKISNRVTFKLKTGITLEIMTPETQALLESYEKIVTGNENGEIVPVME